MISIDSSKNDYIILSSSNTGTKIYMRTPIITQSSNTDTFFETQYGNINYKDRIILSQKLNNPGADNLAPINTSLITQNNVKNNIKFIHDSNYSNRKIIFVKNQDTSDRSRNYLIDNIIQSSSTVFYHLNYYFNNYFNNITNYKDYFNISIKDYIYKDSSSNSDISFTSTRFKISDFSSVPLFSNASSDISLINYVASDFSTLFIDTSLITPIRINKLNLDSSYVINSNIYSYNKLTLDFKNVNTYNFTLYDTSNIVSLNSGNYSSSNSNNSIATFMIKTNNFDILNTRKSNSEIIFDKNNIYLNNVTTLDICSNFYIANPDYKNSTRLSNTLFLSLGNQITGITQYDLYNNIHIVSKSASIFDISKILFSKNINASLLTNTNSKYNTLLASANKDYLLDFTFNYKNSNYNNYNINNAINYNASLFNYIEYKNKKQFDLNLSKIIDFSYINVTSSSNNKYYTNNSFINNVNNLLTINNKDLNSTITASYEVMNNALRFKFKDLNYDNIIYNLNNATTISGNLYSSIVNYDVRYNYGNYFITTTKLDILLQDNSNSNVLNLTKNYPFNYPLIGSYDNSYSRINFYSLQVVNFFILTIGSDFENVDCIFVYHDPTTETDPSFLYPYNNIEIKRDTGIDTLEKAIIVLPGARTSTTNSTFIPAKNGSNLSRKMIQGLIGMNNVPKLLSIVPYDNNFINGRGFANQYQIGDTCNDNEALIKNKINAIKHYSAKDNATTPNNTLKNENFANIVRSSARSRLSQNCIANLRAGTQTTTTTTRSVITPFRLFG
uniref:Uncharacterized protein n=1 Tax=viral metagenome TaxID=1070528 RepID=A0A6C0D4Y4_9ZZZZ